jgi:hypothetical protein
MYILLIDRWEDHISGSSIFRSNPLPFWYFETFHKGLIREGHSPLKTVVGNFALLHTVWFEGLCWLEILTEKCYLIDYYRLL